MIRIAGSTINLTRGDTGYVNVKVEKWLDDKFIGIYEIQPEDVIVLSVKRFLKGNAYIFQKQSVSSGNIKILPEDTENLEYGKYKYDVEIRLPNGDKFTIICNATFNVCREVTE